MTKSFLLAVCVSLLPYISCATDSVPREIMTADSSFSIEVSDILWEQTSGPEGGDFKQFELNHGNPSEMVTGNMRNLYHSTNRGETWDLVVENIQVQDIVSVPSRSGEIYLVGQELSDFQSVVLHSSDGGDTWETISSDNRIHMALHIAVAPDNPKALYVATRDPARLIKSGDGGKTGRSLPTISTLMP